MDKKTGVFICTGCGIGDRLDVDALVQAAEESSPETVKTHAAFCGEEGFAQIQADVADGVNAIVIAACSPRAFAEKFKFDGCIVERANLREHCVYVQPSDAEIDALDVDDDEKTKLKESRQELAEDYIRMSLTRVEKSSLPEPYAGPAEGTEFSKTVLVVGGGVAGLTSAREASAAGYPVVLVEQEAALGGFAKKMRKQARLPYKDLYDQDVDDLVAAVQGDANVKVLLGAKIDKIEGGPGLFEAAISANGASSTEKIGSIVLATGWTPYDAAKLNDLGYGASPDVITNVQLEEMAGQGKITRPSNGQPVTKVAFIQCAGSRDPQHLPYCSSVCCTVSLKQALYLKEDNPETQVYVIYKDMRTPGQSEDLYRKVQQDGAVFIRGKVESVSAEGGQLAILAQDELLGGSVSLDELDLVVLATGLVPSTKPTRAMIDKFLKAEAASGEGEAEKSDEEVKLAEDAALAGGNILNLAYRQGPGLPLLKYGYPDSHFICFPYETRRTGIYAAGTVRRPMGLTDAKEDAAGAACKAIQCAEATAIGRAVHPRAWDLSFPEFFMQRCTQCKRCTEECPFGAINEDEKANPLPNPTRCRRCGVCMGACPERIISFKNYSVDMIGSMIKSIEVPEEDDEKPRIVALVCENDAYAALDAAGLKGKRLSPYVRVIPLRCLGGLNLVWIADALSKGIDGIILLGCRHGDNYQCHFIKGSLLAETRLSKVSETLNRLALESDRVRFREVSIADADKLPEIINGFVEDLAEFDPNPYKGF
jgi:quinone-modifying oxidoreductase subunit QmoB